MRLGVFAKTFVGDNPRRVLQAVKRAGFETAHYNMACSGMDPMPDAIEEADAQAVAQASAISGVPICGVSGTYNMIDPDLRKRERGQHRLKVLAEHCAMMDVDTITLCTGTRHETDQWAWHRDNQTQEAWLDLCREMSKALETAQSHGLRLGIEPELANVVNSAEAARKLLTEMRSSHLAIVFDPANLFERVSLKAQRLIVSEAIAMLGDDIVICHAKDRHADGAFTCAGSGVLDYGHYLGELSQMGFSGPLVAHGLDQNDAPRVARFLSDRIQ